MFEKIKSNISRAIKSGAVWFNSAAGVTIVALPIAQDMFPQLQGYVPEHLYHYGMGALIVSNVFMHIRAAATLAAKGQA